MRPARYLFKAPKTVKGWILDTTNHWWAQYEWYMSWLKPATDFHNSLNQYKFECLFEGTARPRRQTTINIPEYQAMSMLKELRLTNIHLKGWALQDWLTLTVHKPNWKRTACSRDRTKCPVKHLVCQSQWSGQDWVTKEDNWVKHKWYIFSCLLLFLQDFTCVGALFILNIIIKEMEEMRLKIF